MQESEEGAHHFFIYSNFSWDMRRRTLGRGGLIPPSRIFSFSYIDRMDRNMLLTIYQHYLTFDVPLRTPFNVKQAGVPWAMWCPTYIERKDLSI